MDSQTYKNEFMLLPIMSHRRCFITHESRMDIGWIIPVPLMEAMLRFREHHRVRPKGKSFTANSETKAPVLPKGWSSISNSGTKAAVLLGMNKCGSFPLLSALREHMVKKSQFLLFVAIHISSHVIAVSFVLLISGSR